MPDAPQATRPEDENDLLAAEYVVGLLDSDAHAAAAAKSRREPIFAAAVQGWEARLTPMVEGLVPVEPCTRLWPRIARGLPVNYADSGQWWNNLTVWRSATGLAAAIAAGLTLVVLMPDAPSPVGPAAAPDLQPILASTRMETETGQVMFVITLDRAQNRVVVTPIGASGVAGHSHELWVVPGEGAPISLGVMPSDVSASMTVNLPLGTDASLAISVEPEGGSPTGLPTGPVVAQGRLSPV